MMKSPRNTIVFGGIFDPKSFVLDIFASRDGVNNSMGEYKVNFPLIE